MTLPNGQRIRQTLSQIAAQTFQVAIGQYRVGCAAQAHQGENGHGGHHNAPRLGQHPVKTKESLQMAAKLLSIKSTLRCFLIARLVDDTHCCPNDGHNFRYQGKGVDKLRPNTTTPVGSIRIYGL